MPKSLQDFRSGFTLIELAAVIIILAILSAVAIIRYDDSAIVLDSAAQRIAGQIKYARAQSMDIGFSHGFKFNIKNAPARSARNIEGYLKTESGMEQFIDPLKQGVKLTISPYHDYKQIYLKSWNGKAENLYFDMDGRPYENPASFDFVIDNKYLVNAPREIVLAKRNKQKRIIIMPISGEVKVEN